MNNPSPTLEVHAGLVQYTKAARALRRAEHGLRDVRIALLSSFTIDALVPFLEVEAARFGLLADSYIGSFNSVQQELLELVSGCHQHQPEVVFVLQLLEDVCPPLVDDFLTLSAEQREKHCEEIVNTTVSAIESFQSRSGSAVVLGNFVRPEYPPLGILEANQVESLTATVNQINDRLAREVREMQAVHLLDFDELCSQIGLQRWRDERLWHHGHAPLSEWAMPKLAKTCAAFMQAIAASPRKCLVVDLDNTLWGGVLGEAGVSGIQLGHSYPGNVFRAIQKAILQLYDRGVILAISSKNNQSDVDEVFRSHPDMILRTKHFAAVQVNWETKPTNVQEIAQQLNIGLDSMVFLDDNPTECALMQEMLPEVLTLNDTNNLSEDPLALLNLLRQTRVFDRLSFTDEDRQRGQMYQQQTARRQMEQTSRSLDEFLAGLNMKVAIEEANDFSFPRAFELLHKTNQFNMTTRRHSQSAIASIMADPNCVVFTVRVADRFGDNGIVGVAIVRFEKMTAIIDTLLLSCRVIGRTVESALLSSIVSWADRYGADSIEGEFIPTAKNPPAAQFYEQHGFECIEKDDSGKSLWSAAIDDLSILWPDYISRWRDEGNEANRSLDQGSVDRMLQVVADVLDVEPAMLDDDSSPDLLESWDSLNHLNLVMALETEFGIQFSINEALNLQNVGAIRTALSGNRADESSSLVTLSDCTKDQIPALKQFIAESYGPNYVLGVNDDYFRWQFAPQDEPDPNHYQLRLAMVDGEIAGCLGFIPAEISVADENLKGCWLANWMVGERYRKMGLGPQLARDVAKDFEITLALGANEDAKDIFQRMGWADFGILRRYVRVLDAEQAQKLTVDGKLDWPQLSELRPAASDTVTIEHVSRFDDDITGVWDNVWGHQTTVAGTRRTAEFLNWRYADHSDFQYQMFVVQCDGCSVGFGIYRIEDVRDMPLRVARLVELVAPRDLLPTLLQTICQDAAKNDAVAMDFFCSSDLFEDLLVSQGFLKGDHEAAVKIPILYQPIDHGRNGIRFAADLSNVKNPERIDQWYVVKTDGDQDRPN